MLGDGVRVLTRIMRQITEVALNPRIPNVREQKAGRAHRAPPIGRRLATGWQPAPQKPEVLESARDD